MFWTVTCPKALQLGGCPETSGSDWEMILEASAAVASTSLKRKKSAAIKRNQDIPDKEAPNHFQCIIKTLKPEVFIKYTIYEISNSFMCI